MTEHKVGTREEWLARKELLEREDEVNRLTNEPADLRRELPWVPIEKEYNQLLDQVPKGRGEEFRAVRHDEYDEGEGRT